jgi:hypothetical protein
MKQILRRLGFAGLLVLFVITPALARDVGIAWDANQEPEVTGYIVRYGTTPGDYDVSIDVGNRTTWTLTSLETLVKYYVAVEAYSADGLRSDLSTEIIIERESAPCSSTLSTGSASVGTNGAELTVTVTTAPDCVWNATSHADWIVVTPASQTGSSTVALSIAGNPTYSARTSGVTIAGRTVFVAQSALVPVSLTKLAPDMAMPMFTGKTATWTAASTGGVSVLYQFQLYDEFVGKWSLVQDYSATQTFTWTPAKPGRYMLQVRAKDQNSSLPYASQLSSGLFDVNSSKPAALTLTPSKPFPIVTATPVTWTARSRGGIGPIQYQFWMYDGGDNRWTLTRDYGAGNTFAWTPARAGTYAFQVWARSAGSSQAYEVYRGSGYVQVTAGPVKLLAVDADRLLPSPEEVPLTWTAVGTGGAGALEYQYWLYSSNSGFWSVLRDWDASPTVAWTPSEPGTYAIQAWVRTIGSPVVYEAYKGTGYFSIGTSAARLSTFSTNQTFPLPAKTRIQISGDAAGGRAPLEYQFWRYSNGGWTLGQDYGPSNTYSWTPTSGDVGPCAVQMWVRSAGSGVAYEAAKGTGYFVITQ